MSRPDDRVIMAAGWSPYALIPQHDVCDIWAELGPGCVGVWVLLATYANRDGGSCFPMHRTLSTRAGIPRRTLRRHLQDLERAGWISRRWEATATGRRRVYEIHYRSAIPGR